MSEIQLTPSLFYSRLTRLHSVWSSTSSSSDAIVIPAGKTDNDDPYTKTAAVQMWLLKFEFPDTIMVVKKGLGLGDAEGGKGDGEAKDGLGVWFYTSAKKAKMLQSLTVSPPTSPLPIRVTVLERTKDESHNATQLSTLVTLLSSTGKPVGTVPKDVAKAKGDFIDAWRKRWAEEKAEKGVQETDVGPVMGEAFEVKDEEEITNHKLAAQMSTHLMGLFNDEMSSIIDREEKITHEQLAEKIDAKLDDERAWRKVSFAKGWDRGYGDWCYSPIIQSGGNYDLKASASSDDSRLKPGVILCSIGIRYKSYCANVGRTFMIDPHPEQEKNYLFLLSLQKFAVEQCKEGILVKDWYNAVLEQVRKERPELEEHFGKTMGFGTGLEFRDSSLKIAPKTVKEIKAGMVFAMTLSFGDLEDPKKAGQKYSLQLIDTIRVPTTPSTTAELLSDSLKSKDEVVLYWSGDGGDANGGANGSSKDKKSSAKAKAALQSGGGPAAAAARRLRQEQREEGEGEKALRKSHQKELADKRHEEGLERFKEGDAKGRGEDKKVWKRFESYPREQLLPDTKGQMYVDTRKSTLVLPINGFAVPFHIGTLRSVVKQEEGQYTLLKLMFITPGQITGKKEDTPFDDPNANFIRGLTFRSTDSLRFNELHKEITDLKRNAVKREQERSMDAAVVKQADLIENKGGRRIRLAEVSIRPPFEGKKVAGEVEIHQNGIRYVSLGRGEHKVDILFSNIKHLFFQPCDNELICIVHIHLKSVIRIGKKNTQDVQFYREATEAAFDETGNRKRRRQMHDEDEIEQEQEERRHKSRLNKEFKAFADKIAEASDGAVEVDSPFRELGFSGVPHRTNVLMQPTTECLVHLSELPFSVTTLADVEIAHLERVQFGLRNFDMVFVFRDFTRAPVHINNIPMPQLENVKEWLDSVDIPTTSGPVNLNWGPILKTILEDPLEFFEQGGWSFLREDAGSDDSEDESDEESAFDPGSDVYEESEEDDDGSEFSEDASDDEGSESDFDDDGSEDDWDAQEKKAKASDKKKAVGKREASASAEDSASDSEEERRKKKKKAAAASSSKGKAQSSSAKKDKGKSASNGKKR